MPYTPHVIAVHLNPAHTFSKHPVDSIQMVAGLGVEGDAHRGATVQHRSRVARDPSQPNLRQIHLMHRELFDELLHQGYDVRPGQLGENITTQGVELLALPCGTELRIGADAVVRITGLRNPCAQIDSFRPGLMGAVLARSTTSQLIRKAGAMAVVVTGGRVVAGDPIHITLPDLPHTALEPV
ncbi:MOSC domain-containing protein [Rhodoferax sp.]|uniref:MOSC domain-containing protein n=1 Tax=Rhodoferax sp. TaxID=50421 RepID=UPI002748ED90|nr:MOSC domain-containing protein [Rhodoferax sp.]